MKKKIKIMPLAIILFLLVTNIATIVSFRNFNENLKQQELKRNEIPDTQMGPYLRDTLNLTWEQSRQFRDFRRQYNRSVNNIVFEMQQTRNLMMNELKNVQPDRTKLDQLAAELGDLHKELKGLTFDYYSNMQSALDSEQQVAMVDVFQMLLTMDGNAKTPDHAHEENHDHSEWGGRHGRRSAPETIDTSGFDNTFHEFNE